MHDFSLNPGYGPLFSQAKVHLQWCARFRVHLFAIRGDCMGSEGINRGISPRSRYPTSIFYASNVCSLIGLFD